MALTGVTLPLVLLITYLAVRATCALIQVLLAAGERREERRHAAAAIRVLYQLANSTLGTQPPGGTEPPDLRAAGVPSRGRHRSRR
ncbi:hypothetical protein M8C13_08785 [Crossiella sp. SN42]|uniref:hypothetical protein n=1 Tax=Crossiella sp. SN42 TaxID=2944808 RepID=UPI00207C99AA|nr:hypothetical protein [Crossiella sp. SN42]MCO1575851.1 hypothetical protein [Crossiella sp. SN42]